MIVKHVARRTVRSLACVAALVAAATPASAFEITHFGGVSDTIAGHIPSTTAQEPEEPGGSDAFASLPSSSAIGSTPNVTGSSTTGSTAEVEAWTGMGAQGPVRSTLATAWVASFPDPTISPAGANEACTPREGENPVILIHGMNSNSYGSFAALSPYLKEQGKCVYAMNYGATDGSSEEAGYAIAGTGGRLQGLANMDTSVAQVAEHIQQVRENTGAAEVDLVGYSGGGTVAAAYTKSVGGEGVGTVVSLAGVYRGVSAFGWAMIQDALVRKGVPADQAVALAAGHTAVDLLAGSDFLTRLNAGGVEVPGVHYVAISSTYDSTTAPVSNTQFLSYDSHNIVLQDGCAQNHADHLGVPFDTRAMAFVAQALGADVTVPCQASSLLSS